MLVTALLRDLLLSTLSSWFVVVARAPPNQADRSVTFGSMVRALLAPMTTVVDPSRTTDGNRTTTATAGLNGLVLFVAAATSLTAASYLTLDCIPRLGKTSQDRNFVLTNQRRAGWQVI
jgi:hypothetical protein